MIELEIDMERHIYRKENGFIKTKKGRVDKDGRDNYFNTPRKQSLYNWPQNLQVIISNDILFMIY